MSMSWVMEFNRFSGKAQVRRATLFCNSSYLYLRLTDKSKKLTSENSENQFLVMYWYKNNIGKINLIVCINK